MCCELVVMSFADVSRIEENALPEFIEVQVCTGFFLFYCLYIENVP